MKEVKRQVNRGKKYGREGNTAHGWIEQDNTLEGVDALGDTHIILSPDGIIYVTGPIDKEGHSAPSQISKALQGKKTAMCTAWLKTSSLQSGHSKVQLCDFLAELHTSKCGFVVLHLIKDFCHSTDPYK